MSKHFVWYQKPQFPSQKIAGWFFLQGRLHKPQGNRKTGPGFVSISFPTRRRRPGRRIACLECDFERKTEIWKKEFLFLTLEAISWTDGLRKEILGWWFITTKLLEQTFLSGRKRRLNWIYVIKRQNKNFNVTCPTIFNDEIS